MNSESAAWDVIDRAKAGDRDAFGEIYARYHDTIFRFIYFRTGHRQTAEDLTSDTFLRALNRIGSFTWQGTDIGAWLVTIARNLVADHYKSATYRLSVTSASPPDSLDVEPGPDAQAITRETRAAVRAAIANLIPLQREAVELRFIEDLTVHDTAVRMGREDGAIKALTYRAAEQLRRQLREAVR